MEFASYISQAESTIDAAQQLIDQARQHPGRIDLAMVFFTSYHQPQAGELVERLWLELDPQALVGCSAEGVIGGELEVERQPGMSLLVGRLAPGVRAHPFHVSEHQWRQLLSDAELFGHRLGVGPQTRVVIGMGDPWTTPITQLMQVMDTLCPQAPLVGGMASAARDAGQNLLVRNDQTFDEGLVGVSLSGAIQVQTIVSQGARPIGRPLIVTRGHDNVIEQLGGRPALEAFGQIVQDLSRRDQELLEHGLLIGQAISEYREHFGRGDFLVRNVTGVDQQRGAITVGDLVRVGQTVQFHVRDADSADEDLRLMLEAAARSGAAPEAGLLFSCNGRGTRMFDRPGHDITLARRLLPGTPVAGFFAAGEFGPVGGRNFIHGHTASLALLRQVR